MLDFPDVPSRAEGFVNEVTFRAPQFSDGVPMWRLATDSGRLEVNSAYAYLLWCRDFADTSIVARHDGAIVAFVTGYFRPTSPSTLFIWQIAVDSAFQRVGLALRTLDALIVRASETKPIAYIEATVTPNNIPSVRLFEALARAKRSPLVREGLFTEHDFAGLDHEEETLYRIGPLTTESEAERLSKSPADNV